MSSDSPAALPAVLRRSDLAQLLGISVGSVDNLRRRGCLPEPCVSSGRIRLWSQEQIRRVLSGGGADR
jgi:DNA-binding transcriptional MerR regulator